MQVSILIPIHNRLAVTKEGLTNLLKSLDKRELKVRFGIKIRIVVIDDGSTDGSGQFIEQNYPEIHVLKGTGNLWWSGGINKGARFALDQLGADYVVLWNDDIDPNKKYFMHLAQWLHQQKESNIILGSLIYDSGNGRLWSGGGIFNSYTGQKYMLKELPAGIKDSPYEVDWLPGMGTVVPASVIRENGFWDAENFPQYHGDIDFTLRAKNAGFSICVNPNLVIYNNTKYSSFHGTNLREAFRSLSGLNSRYNLRKNVMFYRRFTKTPFWILILVKNYLKYFIESLR